MIDVNVYLSRWPFRRVRGDTPAELVALLRKHGVTQAWAGSFDGLLHKDISAVNVRLAEDCALAGQDLLVPFGSLNPMLPDWQEDLRRIHEVHRMPGIRLHPNYHGYRLQDPVAAEILGNAAKRRLIVQIALAMEDERTQHPLIRVPPVDPAPLAAIVKDLPQLKLMLLNAGRAANPPGVYFDFAMQESPYAVARLVKAAGERRVVFGSFAPLFYFEAARLKLKEAGLSPDLERSITGGNASELYRGALARNADA
ncbi:MAG: amidohydrolase family protein [Bryobacteraceae bacterium]